MKVGRDIVAFVAALAISALCGEMQPVRAGYLKLPHKILAPKGNANPSVVTEDGPFKGVETST
jgi:hypothetical protein